MNANERYIYSLEEQLRKANARIKELEAQFKPFTLMDERSVATSETIPCHYLNQYLGQKECDKTCQDAGEHD